MRRRWLLVGGAVAVGLGLLIAAGIVFLYGPIGEWIVRDKVLPRVAARLDRSVEAAEVEVSRGRVVLRDVVVRGAADGDEPLARVDRVAADFDYWASLRGDVVLGAVEIDGLDARVERAADGSDNLSDLLARLGGDGAGEGAPATSGRAARLRPRLVRLTSGTVQVRDRASGLTLTARGLGAVAGEGEGATATLAEVELASGYGPSASLGQLVVDLELSDPLGSARVEIGDGRIALWQGMSLTGIRGEVRQGDEAGHLIVDLSGGYGGAEGTLWHAEGWVRPREHAGRLELRADRFTFDRIDQVLTDSMVIDYQETSVDAEVVVEVADGRAAIAGELELTDLSLFHPMLAEEPILGLDVAGHIDASFDTVSRHLVVREAAFTTGGVDYRFDGELLLPHGRVAPGAPPREHPRAEAHLVVPEVGCQTMLASIPRAFVPKLQGFELRGTFATDLRVAIDWADLEATELEGSVGIGGCKVVDVPKMFDARRLATTFEHETLVGPEEYETVTIGMESEDFAAIWDISPHLLKSIMTTEDSRFYDHRGFITREFRTALIRDLEAGYFKYGASSITMQMVKNVFLYRDKTLSRKLQELFLTWYVEQVLDKNRILEIYVNAIEYGPGIYGIKSAAEIYFDKHPRELDPVEAAYFSTLLPAPRRRYFQYCTGRLSRWTANKIQRILRLMHERDRLTEDEYEEALETPLEFNPVKRKDLCKKRPDW